MTDSCSFSEIMAVYCATTELLNTISMFNIVHVRYHTYTFTHVCVILLTHTLRTYANICCMCRDIHVYNWIYVYTYQWWMVAQLELRERNRIPRIIFSWVVTLWRHRSRNAAKFEQLLRTVLFDCSDKPFLFHPILCSDDSVVLFPKWCQGAKDILDPRK